MPGGGKADEIVARILKKPPAERLKLLRESKNPQAQFLWAILRDSFHYAAVHLAEIAESARDVDFAMRWGFGISQGPFELWQAAGWGQVAQWIKEDIEAGKALSNAPLPAWVFEGPVADNQRRAPPRRLVEPGARALGAAPARCRSTSASASRENVLGADAPAALEVAAPRTSRNDEVRVWTLDGEVLIASITAKLHLISPLVIEGLQKAVEIAEAKYQGLVIWSPDDVFSAGANLESLMPVFMKAGAKGIEPEIKKLQDRCCAGAMRPCRSSRRCAASRSAAAASWRSIRRVAWPRWRATSAWSRSASAWCRRGGGLTYIARRAAEMAGAANANADILAFLPDGFTAAAMAKVGTSAIESAPARLPAGERHRSCRTRTSCCTSPARRSKAMHDSGYRPPARTPFPVAGRIGDRDDQGAARQHARRRLHQPARLPHLVADRRRGVRRRRRCRLAGHRGVPDDARAQALLQPARAPEDAGTDHGHAADRQAGQELKEQWTWTQHRCSGPSAGRSRAGPRHLGDRPMYPSDERSMSKQIQEAYIVAATRTPIGKAPRGYFKNTRSDDLLVLAIQSALKQVPTLDPKAIEDAIIGCSFPEAEQGMNMARIAVMLAGLPH